MSYIANLMACYITHYIPSFSCYISQLVYKTSNACYIAHPNLPDEVPVATGTAKSKWQWAVATASL